MAKFLTFSIRAYKLVISPLLPTNSCRFHPTCSQYAIDAIARFGALHGLWQAAKRVCKCHPFHAGGFDPA